MNLMVFDIETIPDVEAGRRLNELIDLSDEDVATLMQKKQQEKSGSDFLPHYLQRIVAISIVLKNDNQLQVWSLGDCNSSEKEIIERFFNGIQRYTPTLVSWNGSGFDLPVLHYRALRHGVSAASYWETGDHNNQFRYNNYLNRFHNRHTDLMDVLAGYQTRANAPLDQIATLLGFPGKMGMSGSLVWQNYQNGEIEAIRNYCETDVLNTYLIYLRFELLRGTLLTDDYEKECQQLDELLLDSGKQHLIEFAENWSNKPE